MPPKGSVKAFDENGKVIWVNREDIGKKKPPDSPPGTQEGTLSIPSDESDQDLLPPPLEEQEQDTQAQEVYNKNDPKNAEYIIPKKEINLNKFTKTVDEYVNHFQNTLFPETVKVDIPDALVASFIAEFLRNSNIDVSNDLTPTEKALITKTVHKSGAQLHDYLKLFNSENKFIFQDETFLQAFYNYIGQRSQFIKNMLEKYASLYDIQLKNILQLFVADELDEKKFIESLKKSNKEKGTAEALASSSGTLPQVLPPVLPPPTTGTTTAPTGFTSSSKEKILSDYKKLTSSEGVSRMKSIFKNKNAPIKKVYDRIFQNVSNLYLKGELTESEYTEMMRNLDPVIHFNEENTSVIPRTILTDEEKPKTAYKRVVLNV